MKDKIFNINDYDIGSTVMHCDTYYKAKCFLQLKVIDESKLSVEYTDRYFDNCKNQLCFALYGEFCELDWYKDKGYTVLEFDDFTWNETNKQEMIEDIERCLWLIEVSAWEGGCCESELGEMEDRLERVKKELENGRV